MSDLRTRIAAVISESYPGKYGNSLALLTADAVISELGLTVETTTDKWIGGGMDLHRYVTDWEADDE